MDTRMAKASWLGAHRNSEYSAIVIGAIVTFIFVLLLLTLNEKVTNLQVGWAGVAGAITYPLFLIHGRIGFLVIQNLGNDSNNYLIYALTLILLIGVAYLLLKLEKKVLNLEPFRMIAVR